MGDFFHSPCSSRLLFSVKKRPFYGNGGAATSPRLQQQQQKNVRELFAALPAAAGERASRMIN